MSFKSVRRIGCSVFCLATRNSFPPHSKWGCFHFFSHKHNNRIFGQSELVFDRFKWSTIFPCHFDNAINRSGLQITHTNDDDVVRKIFLSRSWLWFTKLRKPHNKQFFWYEITMLVEKLWMSSQQTGTISALWKWWPIDGLSINVQTHHPKSFDKKIDKRASKNERKENAQHRINPLAWPQGLSLIHIWRCRRRG